MIAIVTSDVTSDLLEEKTICVTHIYYLSYGLNCFFHACLSSDKPTIE